MTTTAIPIRSVAGYGPLLWSFRQWFRKQRSFQWAQALGTIERYEFLSASRNGWLVVYYSYAVDGQSFSGELRRWLLFSFSSIEAATEKITTRLPIGAKIDLRVNPNHPSMSIACL